MDDRIPALCRDCFTRFSGSGRCPECRSPRVLRHAELFDLSVAHLDCDAFYASVEKRDDPALADRPVIVGGGRRGVVSTCCYLARIKGVRSAMPMFQALKLCPEAVVLRGRIDVYAAVSKDIRRMMEALTPLVEPLSLDEAFLDLTGTARLHHAPPAVLLARLARQIETGIGVTVSVGLSHNKFLAKIASDIDKPRGFSVVGRAETESFLDRQQVGVIWGVGAVFQEALARDGIRTVADLKRRDRKDLIRAWGQGGDRLWHLARGLDNRQVSRNPGLKTISHETTFFENTADPEVLDGHLWRLAEMVSDRAKAKDLAGRVVALKLKRGDFTLISRRHALSDATQLADTIYREARAMLEKELARGPFRLIGVGLSDIIRANETRAIGDLLDPDLARRSAMERATDEIRERFGTAAILKGRALH
jgi:DNA polymerase IV